MPFVDSSNMRLGKLSYVTLWAVKFDETRRFYKDVLGIPVSQENPSFIMFDTKGSRLAFHRMLKGPRLDRQTVELHLEVDDVDEIYSSLQKKGVKFEERPANRPWGTRMASLRDPEGYTVEIIGPLREGEQIER
ncbi:VOC family protein [Candidatus Bathyarchaeota archaeon]|nr:VOC family protein [Candidatus Bathyarchaeota archaeon]